MGGKAYSRAIRSEICRGSELVVIPANPSMPSNRASSTTLGPKPILRRWSSQPGPQPARAAAGGATAVAATTTTITAAGTADTADLPPIRRQTTQERLDAILEVRSSIFAFFRFFFSTIAETLRFPIAIHSESNIGITWRFLPLFRYQHPYPPWFYIGTTFGKLTVPPCPRPPESAPII